MRHPALNLSLNIFPLLYTLFFTADVGYFLLTFEKILQMNTLCSTEKIFHLHLTSILYVIQQVTGQLSHVLVLIHKSILKRLILFN